LTVNKFHRFLWRENDEPTVYQFNCVTFGDRSSPFSTSYVVKRVIQDHGEGKPEATEDLNIDLYMDVNNGSGVGTYAKFWITET
jgi:hypothetical protein